MAGEKAQRRPAIALLASYHEAQLANLIEHVRAGLARYDAGEIDAFEFDAVMHRYQRAARELWKFCSASGVHAVTVARLLEESTAAGDVLDWWELAKPRER